MLQLFILLTKAHLHVLLLCVSFGNCFGFLRYINFWFTATYLEGNSMSSPMQSLTSTSQPIVSFYKHLCKLMPQPQANTLPLSHHSSPPAIVQPPFVGGSLDSTLLARQLEKEIFYCRSHTFSDNTETTYRSHRTSFLCFAHGLLPVPAQTEQIC